jgi:hypothetical protein
MTVCFEAREFVDDAAGTDTDSIVGSVEFGSTEPGADTESIASSKELSASPAAPIAAAAFAGAVSLILLKVITPDEAYAGLRPEILMLIAGMVVIGTAMELTGLAKAAADQLMAVILPLGPVRETTSVTVLWRPAADPASGGAPCLLMAKEARPGEDDEPVLCFLAGKREAEEDAPAAAARAFCEATGLAGAADWNISARKRSPTAAFSN